MAVKSSGVGLFTIPTAPSVGTTVATTLANTYSATYVTLQSSGSLAALFVPSITVVSTSSLKPTYCNVQIATGASGSESIVGQLQIESFNSPAAATGIIQGGNVTVWPPIAVAANVRIAAKVADSIGGISWAVNTQAILQTNVVAEGVIQETVNVLSVNGTSQTAKDIGGAVPAVAAGASGGLLISGSNSGTTTLAALTVTGATTHTGSTTYTGNVAYADGITVSAPSTADRAGITITGNSSGAGIKMTGGGTGIGLNVVGGGTSGDGIKVTTTSGHGLNLAPVGTSMHGLLSTGGNGGTSDGIKAAAGTGGVDIRANITGTLTTVTTVSGQLTAGQIATGVWTDTTAGDFTTALSVGKSVMNGVTLGTGLTVNDITTKTGYSLAVTPPTAAAIATSVWTDTTATDFTTALSVGKSVMNGVTLGTGLTINAYTGNTVQTGDAFARLGAAGAGLTALGDTRIANLDATVTSRMATYTQPTGFLAATFPSGTIANTTNITAGTITTATTATNLTTNNDKTGYSLVAGYDLAKTAAQAGNAMALTAGERTSVADALLNRDLSTGSDSGSTTVRTPRQALRFLRNKWAIAAGTLTVYKEDDSTSSWTAAVSTDATALPIISNDPAGP